MLQPEDGGVAEHVLRLATGLLERGWDVEVAGSAGSAIRAAVEGAGAPFHELPVVRAPGAADAGAATALRRLDRDRGYALVHAHSSKAGALARTALPRPSRVVYTPHCFAFLAGPDLAGRRLYLAIERALATRCGAIVAVSEWERRQALEALPGAAPRIHLIRNGVVPCAEAEPDPELREWAGDRPLAGLVTVLRPQKDPVTALRAVALLAGRGRLPGRLAVVGNGELAAGVGEAIESLGIREHARLFPFAGDVAPYLLAMDLFVLPSRWEALPLAPLEAMACGLPVVATDVGGVPELLDDGVTGRLVAPRDEVALAAALEPLLADADARRAMGEAGRRVARERFGLDRMVGGTEALYRDLLD